jgi:hypothetical protein
MTMKHKISPYHRRFTLYLFAHFVLRCKSATFNTQMRREVVMSAFRHTVFHFQLKT